MVSVRLSPGFRGHIELGVRYSEGEDFPPGATPVEPGFHTTHQDGAVSVYCASKFRLSRTLGSQPPM